MIWYTPSPTRIRRTKKIITKPTWSIILFTMNHFSSISILDKDYSNKTVSNYLLLYRSMIRCLDAGDWRGPPKESHPKKDDHIKPKNSFFPIFKGNLSIRIWNVWMSFKALRIVSNPKIINFYLEKSQKLVKTFLFERILPLKIHWALFSHSKTVLKAVFKG